MSTTQTSETFMLETLREEVRSSIQNISHIESIPESDAKSQLLRPTLAYVTAQELGLPLDHEGFVRAMAASQVIHEASLYHDDVIDEGKYRRGKPTLPRQVGNRIAVMQGDKFIAAAFKLIARSDSILLMKDFAQTIEGIINGEVLQNKKIGETLSWETYEQINAMKTGELFGFAMRIPFYFLANPEEARMKRASQLGLSIGTFYQYIDDFLDYNLFSTSGKPPYQDFKAQKWTLVPHFVKDFSWEGGLSDFWKATYKLEWPEGKERELQALQLRSPLQAAGEFLITELTALQLAVQKEFSHAQVLLELLDVWKAKISHSQMEEQQSCLEGLNLLKYSKDKELPSLEVLEEDLYQFLTHTAQSHKERFITPLSSPKQV